jgi:hypothetical protein
MFDQTRLHIAAAQGVSRLSALDDKFPPSELLHVWWTPRTPRRSAAALFRWPGLACSTASVRDPPGSLRAARPALQEPDAIFIRDGPIWTSAGPALGSISPWLSSRKIESHSII